MRPDGAWPVRRIGFASGRKSQYVAPNAWRQWKKQWFRQNGPAADAALCMPDPGAHHEDTIISPGSMVL